MGDAAIGAEAGILRKLGYALSAAHDLVWSVKILAISLRVVSRYPLIWTTLSAPLPMLISLRLIVDGIEGGLTWLAKPLSWKVASPLLAGANQPEHLCCNSGE